MTTFSLPMSLRGSLTGVLVAVLLSASSVSLAGASEDCAAVKGRQDYAEAFRRCIDYAETAKWYLILPPALDNLVGRDEARMIRIAITTEAYEAIARTLALGTVVCEPQPNENGERLMQPEERWLDARRGRGPQRLDHPADGWLDPPRPSAPHAMNV
jgi:hypothetical protein